MGWNGLGVYLRSRNWVNDANAGLNIEANLMDQEADNIASGINNCITKDGQNSPSQDLPMAGQKHTNVGNASARDQYLPVGQRQDGYACYGGDSAGDADNLTVPDLLPAIPAYVEGMMIGFKATTKNNDDATLEVNARGQRFMQTGGENIKAGQIIVGQIYIAMYDGANWQMMSATPPVSNFVDLLDTPAEYVDGDQGKYVRVNDTFDGLEFTDIPPRVAGHMQRVTAQSIPHGSWTEADLVDSIIDVGSIVDLAGNRFLIGAGQDGLYQCGITVEGQSGGTNVAFFAALYLNGTLVPGAKCNGVENPGGAGDLTGPTATMQWILELVDTDYVEMFIGQRNDASSNLDAEVINFQIHKV